MGFASWQGQEIILLSSVSKWLCGRGSFPGVKQVWHEVDYLFPSNANIRNDWSYISAPCVWLHGVVKDIFNFICTLCVMLLVCKHSS
jgi:hypothetical protein